MQLKLQFVSRKTMNHFVRQSLHIYLNAKNNLIIKINFLVRSASISVPMCVIRMKFQMQLNMRKNCQVREGGNIYIGIYSILNMYEYCICVSFYPQSL